MKLFFPEFFLSSSILFLLLFNTFNLSKPSKNFLLIEKECFSQVFFVLFFVLLLSLNNTLEGVETNNIFFVSSSIFLIKNAFLSLLLLSVLPIWRAFVLQRLNLFEFFILFLCSVLASLFLLSANNLLTIYLCLEMQSLSFYALAAFYRKSIHSSEAGLKYFTSSSLFSSIFLLGCVFLYGCFGTSNLSDLQLLLLYPIDGTYAEFTIILEIGFFLIISTFLFKLTIAPYHVWFPQIYDGAPLSATIIFAIVPKLLIFTLMCKLFGAINTLLPYFMGFLLVVGLYSVFFGTFEALKQKKLKKLIIYSTISQMGLPLCALTDFSVLSISAVFFFIIIYLVTTIIGWSFFGIISTNLKLSQQTLGKQLNIYPLFLSNFSNLFKINSIYAFILLIFFFSLAGIPPLVGFLMKIGIYLSLVSTWKYELAILLLYISAFGVYYYIRCIKIAFFENTTREHYTTQTLFNQPLLQFETSLLAILILFLIILGLYPNLLFLFTQSIASALLVQL